MMESQGETNNFRAFEQFYVQHTRLPAGRIGSPVDVANMVAYLSSPLANVITGASFRVDGSMMPTTNGRRAATSFSSRSRFVSTSLLVLTNSARTNP